jgi:small-conductance mechanosensitive channel
VPLWFLLAGVVVAARLAPIDARWTELAEHAAAAVFFVSLSICAARVSGDLLVAQAKRDGGSVASTTLIQNLVRGAVLLVGALLVLANLGVSITPLLTALGVGSLAVALALQPTLTNLFAGLYIAVARPIRVSDLVELENGLRGVVLDIGWRITRIRTLTNSTVIVPNSKLADMIVTNHEMPEPELNCPVEASVGYRSDLGHVERVAREVAKDVMVTVPGGVATHDPAIRFHTFGDSAIQFTIVLRARHFTDQGVVKHELIKRLKKRFDAEGIEIPFPQRVVQGELTVRDLAKGGGAGA